MMTDLEIIKQTLDGFGEQLERLEARAVGAEQRFDRLDAHTVKADKRFDRLEAHAVKADKRFDRLEAQAVKAGERLENIEVNMATKMELARTRASLEEGQDLLLRVIRGHSDQLGAIQPALSELDRRVSTLEAIVGNERG